MEKQFKLECEDLYKMQQKYTECAEQINKSLFVYLKDLNDILGVGWKGNASAEFAKVVTDYVQSTNKLTNELLRKKEIMSSADNMINDIENRDLLNRRKGERYG